MAKRPAPASTRSDPRPTNCRERLAHEGKPFPRSSCAGCGGDIITGFPCRKVEEDFWRSDIENARKDRTILVWGIPETHPELHVRYKKPAIFAAHWDQCDEAFCINGGDWLGPFIEPLMWADINPPKETPK